MAKGKYAKSNLPAGKSAPASRTDNPRKRLPKVLLSLVLGLLLLAALIGGGSYVYTRVSDPYDCRILDSVTIGGIDVGGMTRREAAKALEEAVSPVYVQSDMVLVLADTTLRLTPADTGASLNIKSAVDAAYAIGRTDSEHSPTEACDIPLLPHLKVNTDAIRQVLTAYTGGETSLYIPSGFRFIGGLPTLQEKYFNPNVPCQTLEITLGAPGTGVDVEGLLEQILDAYSRRDFLVEVPSGVANAVPEPIDLDAIYETYCSDAVDSVMDPETYQPLPASYGYRFDLEAARSLLDGASYGDTVTIPMEYVLPSVTSDKLLFQDVLGECRTPYSNNPKRIENLRLVCTFLDGTIVNPGESLSYNETVGERTKERGFQAAPAYSGTRLVDSIGGGVCQGSSTLYYSCLMAEMEILERVNHGFPVSYIPLGLDATVSWYGPDYRFQNSSDFPIQIHAWLEDDHMCMQILGTEVRDYYVKLDSRVTGYSEPSVTYERRDADAGYHDGQVLDKGTSGRYVRSFICKYDPVTNEEISREDLALSSYMSKPKIIAVVG